MVVKNMKTIFVKIFSFFFYIILIVLFQKRVFCTLHSTSRHFDYDEPVSKNLFVYEGKKYDSHQPKYTHLNSTRGDDDKTARNFVREHEILRRTPVKMKVHESLGTLSPDSNTQFDFVPQQIYYQVRRYDTEVHLPKNAALTEAETAEEIINAPRLREIVSHKKTQEVRTHSVFIKHIVGR